jgi:hypothetical protein
VADAIDREQHGISAADETGQQPATFLDAAVMVQEYGTEPFGVRAQMPICVCRPPT